MTKTIFMQPSLELNVNIKIRVLSYKVLRFCQPMKYDDQWEAILLVALDLRLVRLSIEQLSMSVSHTSTEIWIKEAWRIQTSSLKSDEIYRLNLNYFHNLLHKCFVTLGQPKLIDKKCCQLNCLFPVFVLLLQIKLFGRSR